MDGRLRRQDEVSPRAETQSRDARVDMLRIYLLLIPSTNTELTRAVSRGGQLQPTGGCTRGC